MTGWITGQCEETSAAPFVTQGAAVFLTGSPASVEDIFSDVLRTMRAAFFGEIPWQLLIEILGVPFLSRGGNFCDGDATGPAGPCQCGREMYTSKRCTAGRTRRMISVGQSLSLSSVTQPSSGSQTEQKVYREYAS
jgi:hypothetical protein